MSQIVYRANLAAKMFPFLAEDFGQSIIVSGPDQAFNRQTVSPEDSDKDIGIPQIYYCHNVMPISQGFTAVGFDQAVPAQSTVSNGYFMAFQVWDAQGRNILISVRYNSTTNVNEFWTYDGSIWVSIGSAPVGAITSCHVQGVSYIYVAGYGAFTYDFDAKVFVGVTLNALSVSNSSAATWVASTAYTVGQIVNAPTMTGLWYQCTVAGTSGATAPTFPTDTGYNFLDGTVWWVSIFTTTIKGITNAAGYVIAYDNSSIYWSSTLPISGGVIDFTPSIITGAGSMGIEAAQGPLTAVVPSQMGMYVYTSQNTIFLLYTQNFLNPFQARELVGSGGVTDDSQVAIDINAINHYAYTTDGLQMSTTNSANTVIPEVTDFISGRRFEDFNTSTLEFEYTDLPIGSPMVHRIAMIASRYLVISYGLTQYTHALVFDLIMKRWGKLRWTHVQAFEYDSPNALVSFIPKQSLALLDTSGRISTVCFAENSYFPHDSVLLLGKYQYARSRTLQMDQISLENVPADSTFQLTNMYTLDGKTFLTSTPTLLSAGTGCNKYGCRDEGINHSLLLQGIFRTISVELAFNVGGKR